MSVVLILALALSSSFSFAKVSTKTESDEVRASVYWVPVPVELQQFAVFTTKSVEIKTTNDDQIKIEYDLPEELTGALNHIEFSGQRPATGSFTLNGNLGHMECPNAQSFNACKVFYENLKIDPTLRSELLKSISQTPDELSKREAVALSFCTLGGEPCGFLTVY